MKLSRSLLALPIAALLAAGAAATGACSSSVSVNVPASAVVTPGGDVHFPDGIVVGSTSCEGDLYFIVEDGWAFCDDGIWDYTRTDPDTFGGDYTTDGKYADFYSSESSESSDSSGSSNSGSSHPSSSDSTSSSTPPFTQGQGGGQG